MVTNSAQQLRQKNFSVKQVVGGERMKGWFIHHEHHLYCDVHITCIDKGFLFQLPIFQALLLTMRDPAVILWLMN